MTVAEDPERRYKLMIARAALTAAGISPKRLASLVRLIDPDLIEVDDAGNITGLDEQIEELRGEFTEAFSAADVGAESATREGLSDEDVLEMLSPADRNAVLLEMRYSRSAPAPRVTSGASAVQAALLRPRDSVPSDEEGLSDAARRVIAIKRSRGDHAAAKEIIDNAQRTAEPDEAA